MGDSGSMSTLIGDGNDKNVVPPPPPPPLNENDNKFDDRIYKKLMPQIPVKGHSKNKESNSEIVQLINDMYDDEKKKNADDLLLIAAVRSTVSHYQPNL